MHRSGFRVPSPSRRRSPYPAFHFGAGRGAAAQPQHRHPADVPRAFGRRRHPWHLPAAPDPHPRPRGRREPLGAGLPSYVRHGQRLGPVPHHRRPGRQQPRNFDGWAWVQDDRRWFPLYEAKLLSHYDARFSTYAVRDTGTAQRWHSATAHRHTARRPCASSRSPGTGSPRPTVDKALTGRWDRGWLFGWRDITRAERRCVR